MNGVDISHYQRGLTIRQIKDAGREFAILKLTEGTGPVDDAAFAFYREAYETGFPVGCYCYSHALTPEAAREEAAYLLDAINGFPMPCGIFLDMEEPKQLGLSHDGLLNIVRAWCAAIGRAGYFPGVYGSAGTLWAKLRPEELPDNCLVWTAKWGAEPPDMPCDLWQSGDNGRIPGYDGPVDTDAVRSKRFRRLAAPFRPTPPAADVNVTVLQLLMRYNGLWDAVDGVDSEKYRERFRRFAGAVLKEEEGV